MKINKLSLLKAVLYAGALYYVIGAFAHLDGLTVFPFFDGGLYAPYQDSIIALAALVFAIILSFVAHDPANNRDALKAVIVSAALATVFSFGVVWKMDFAVLGGPGKKIQTVCEGILGIAFTILLVWLYPRKGDK